MPGRRSGPARKKPSARASPLSEWEGPQDGALQTQAGVPYPLVRGSSLVKINGNPVFRQRQEGLTLVAPIRMAPTIRPGCARGYRGGGATVSALTLAQRLEAPPRGEGRTIWPDPAAPDKLRPP